MGKISDLIKGIATGGEKRFNSAVVLASGSGKDLATTQRSSLFSLTEYPCLYEALWRLRKAKKPTRLFL